MSTLVLIGHDPVFAQMLSQVIEQLGPTVMLPSTVEEALDVLRQSPQRLLVFLALEEAGQGVLSALAHETALLLRHQITVCVAAYDLVIPPLVAQWGLDILLKPFDQSDLAALIASFEQT